MKKIHQVVKMLCNNKASATSITVYLIILHLSLFVTLHQNDCFEMKATTTNYSVHKDSYQLSPRGVLLNLNNLHTIISVF